MVGQASIIFRIRNSIVLLLLLLWTKKEQPTILNNTVT